MFGQSLLSGAFGTALVPDENFGINLYTGSGTNQKIGGKIKGAASFNGSSSAINILSPIGQASGNENDDFTSSIWVNFDTITGTAGGFNGAIIGNNAASIYAAFALYAYGHASGISIAMERYFNNTGYYNSSYTSAAPFAAVINTWYHIATTYVGSTKTVTHYIDGTALTAYTLDTNAGSRTMNPNLGLGSYNGSSSGFDGQIDQLRIFNTILTPSQISSLATETAATANTLNFPAGAGCVAAYQLDTNGNTVLSQADLDTCNFPTGAGCLALYQFTNNSNDTCGSYNGTDSNITYSNGVFNKAASFNGSSSKISLGNQTFFNAGDYSVSFWLNNQGNDSNYQIVMSQRTSSDSGSPINISMYGVSYGSNDGKLYFAVGGSYFVSNTVLSKNTWYHLVFTIVAGGNMNIYVDGVLDSNSTTESTTRPTPTTQNLAIGANGSNTDYPFNGLIDQVRFFSTALTQSQVTELARGEPKYNGTTTTVSFNGWTNFKPGFTWFKKRNGGTGNNILINSPGLKTSLAANAYFDAGYYDQYGYLSSFEDYGFVTAAGSNGTYPYDNVGESGSDYVSWNWKAGAETYSTYFNGTEGSGGSYAFGVPAAAATALRTAAAFSISIWANPDQTAKPGAYDPEIVRFLNDTYLRLIHQDGGTVRLLVNDSSNTSKECISSALTPGKWTHICATGSSSGLKLYIDGTEVDSDTWDGTFWTYSSAYYQNNTIGSAENTGGSPPANPHSVFKGYLSQYRLYNAQLTPTQVSTLYNETAADNATLNYPAGAGAIALYQLKGNCTETSGTYSPTSEANLVQSRPNYLGGNTDGTMSSQVNANADAGFSIVKYIGNGTSGATIGHGLGKIPELAFFKNMDQGSSSYNWSVYSGPNGPTGLLYLNDTYAFTVTSSRFNDTAPTNQVFTLGNDGTINASGDRHIAYCWTSIDKYSKIGSYVGNNPTAVSVDLGFAPSWIMVKNTTSAADWVIYDNKRNPTGNFDNYLLANLADAEGTTGGNYLTPTATGFTTNSSGGSWVNENGSTFIYLAFA